MTRSAAQCGSEASVDSDAATHAVRSAVVFMSRLNPGDVMNRLQAVAGGIISGFEWPAQASALDSSGAPTIDGRPCDRGDPHRRGSPVVEWPTLTAMRWAFFAVAPLVVSLVGHAQQPVFRAGVDLVTVDAIVVDKDGRPVTGFTADDFTL